MRSLLSNLKNYFLLLSALLLSFCSHPKPTKKAEPVFIRLIVQNIVDSIAKYNQLNGSAVGYAGISTPQWDRYEKLRKTATLRELRELTHHRNTVVRCYAFNALTAKKDTSSFNILLDHLKDTARVSTFIGCLISREMVGDYFLNAVRRYDSADKGFRLSPQQMAVTDSILLFDKHILLSARYRLLDDLEPDAKYYDRVKEIATHENEPVALLALSRFKKQSDLPLISKGFSHLDTEDYAIRSVIQMPDSRFYKQLTHIFEREWNEKLYDYFKWRMLYKALAQYPNEPQTVAFFKQTIQTKDEFRHNTLGTFLLAAITKYPNPIFEPLKQQIKLNEYELDDVKRFQNEKD